MVVMYTGRQSCDIVFRSCVTHHDSETTTSSARMSDGQLLQEAGYFLTWPCAIQYQDHIASSSFVHYVAPRMSVLRHGP